MKSLVKRTVVCGGLMYAVMLLLGASMQPLQGLRVPIDFYPDGTLKHEIRAAEALAREDGTLEAQGVAFRLFSASGEEEVLIRAEDASVDRARSQGYSEGAVFLERDQLQLTGEGFEWNGRGETIRILRNVRMSFPSQMFRERPESTGEDNARE